LFTVFASTLTAGAYRIIKKIPIAGDGGWDYVAADSEGRRLYVSHNTEIVVLDLDSGAIVGKITAGEDTHGAAIARELGRGFISASDPGSVTIFDLKTLATIGKVRVGDDPNGIIYDRKTQRVFTADRGSKRITAIDAKTGKIAGTIENLGGRTEHLASDEAGHVFLNMQDRNTTLKLDAQELKVMETWPLTSCEAPSSMDIDRAHQRIFIGCRGGTMAVVDITAGAEEQTLRILSELDPEHPLTSLDEVRPRLDRAENWITTQVPAEQRTVVRSAPDTERLATLGEADRGALKLLLDGLDSHWSLDGLSTLVYAVPKVQAGLAADTKPTPELKVAQRQFFALLYELLVGRDTGPRLPTLLLAVGQERVRELLTGAGAGG